MPRIVRLDRDGPYKIEPQDIDPTKPIFICGCGLTKKAPFCDGTHKTCKNEVPGKTYRYDDQGMASEVD